MVQTQSLINENSLTEILPGGSNPDAFELAQAWYPVHYLQDLDKSKPTPFRGCLKSFEESKFMPIA